MQRFLAIDIGASSGRHVVGWMEDGICKTEEVYRFPNGVKQEGAHLTWDVEELLRQVKVGIRFAFQRFGDLKSLSIDTWGVDYVRLQHGRTLLPCFSYRDSRTNLAVSKVHDLTPFDKLYNTTGCQFQPFNTIYQLYDDLLCGRLEGVTDILMIPEYLIYRLTGVRLREYTNATTTGLVNVKTKEFDGDLIRRIGFPDYLFPKLAKPGCIAGKLLPEVEREVGGNCNVVLGATHDTASAVEGIPMTTNAPYISSGTWSLLGIKTPHAIVNTEGLRANFSNEGGIGYNRYQKNIMGLWLINELKREICLDASFNQITQMAQRSNCNVTVDANKPVFLSPSSMKAAFDAEADGRLNSVGDYFRCAYRSLALCYRNAVSELERITGITSDLLYIVGGGAKNEFLNDLTREATGKHVIALPIEATALGNLKVQMEVKQ